MTSEHAHVALARRVGHAISAGELAGAGDLFAEKCVWHYFNPGLPELAGDYVGPSGVDALFARLATRSGDTFEWETRSVQPFGDELVVAHVRPTLMVDGTRLETDAVVVWRVYESRIAEVWDIAAIYAVRPHATQSAGPVMKVRISWSEREWQGVLAALEQGAEPRLDPHMAALVRTAAERPRITGDAEPHGQLTLSLQEGQAVKAWCDARRERAATEADLGLWTRIVARVNEAVQVTAPARE